MPRLARSFAICLAAGLSYSTLPDVRADDATAKPAAAAAPTAAAEPAPAQAITPEIAGLIKDLNNDDFNVRKSASEKLVAAGKNAIPALAEAAQSSTLEVMSQAFGALRELKNSPDAGTRDAAKAALEKVAASTNTTAAQRAKELLETQKAATPGNDPNGLQLNGGNIIVGNGGIGGRIQVMPAIPGGGIQINGGNIIVNKAKMSSKSVSNINGVKTTKVKQDGLEVEIIEAKEEITVKKTENGKSEEFKAKDLEELKKKHPAGHELYEKHAKDDAVGGVFQIQVGAGGLIPALPLQPAIPAQAIPLQRLLPAIPAAAPANPKLIRDSQLKAAERQLQSAIRSLKTAAESTDDKDALKPALESLEKTGEQLKAISAKLQSKTESAEKPGDEDAKHIEEVANTLDQLREQAEKAALEAKNAATQAVEDAKQAAEKADVKSTEK